jgi:type 1 glutamine amidotransferase
MKVVILSGSNHGFESSARAIDEFLRQEADIDVHVVDDKDILCALNGYDACVFGTGFTRTVRLDDGTLERLDDLTPQQEHGLFDFVHGGGGLVGTHGTAWWIPSRAVPLLGGHANWHPPGLIFEVQIADTEHPITRDVSDFEVEDEIYMSAWDPAIHILATATWQEKEHPLAWTQPYGAGRVFYTALGHTAATFARPMMQRLMINGVRWVASRSQDQK